jgi:predicted PurR-regulated permease PerM
VSGGGGLDGRADGTLAVPVKGWRGSPKPSRHEVCLLRGMHSVTGHADRLVASAPTTIETTSASPDTQLASQLLVSSWTVARITLVVALTLGVLLVLARIQEVLVLLVLAVLLATAIEPLVNSLRRGPFSRGQGILIVYSVIFAVIATVGFLFIPGIMAQGATFISELPARIADLRPLADQVGFTPLRTLILRAIDDLAPALNAPAEVAAPNTERLVEAGSILAHTMFSTLTVFLLAYYWLTERAAIKRAILRFAPAHHARQVNATWLRVEEKLGAWVRGQLLIMLALALMSGIIFFALGLPSALLLAALAGVFEMVPLVGPFLAFVPALLVALAADPTKALILIPLAFLVQQIEGNILVPRIMSHSVGVSPLTVILGILIGSILSGAAGAFLAVPLAAAVQVILNDTLRPSLENPTSDVPVPTAELEGDSVPKVAMAEVDNREE